MHKLRFSISRKGLTTWEERFRESMFWQQNNLTCFKKLGNYIIPRVSGGVGDLVCCFVPVLRMLSVSAAERVSTDSALALFPLLSYMGLGATVVRLNCSPDLSWSLRARSQFNVCRYLSPTGDLLCTQIVPWTAASHAPVVTWDVRRTRHACNTLGAITLLQKEKLLLNYLLYKVSGLKAI